MAKQDETKTETAPEKAEVEKAFELIELAHNEIDALVEAFQFIEEVGTSEEFRWQPVFNEEAEAEKVH